MAGTVMRTDVVERMLGSLQDDEINNGTYTIAGWVVNHERTRACFAAEPYSHKYQAFEVGKQLDLPNDGQARCDGPLGNG